jgi:hypothetical protein
MTKVKTGSRTVRKSADPEALLSRARLALEDQGVVKLAALGSPAVRATLVARLVQEGYEATKSAVRRPLEQQLSRSLADGAFISLKSAASHVAGAPSTEAKAVALRLVAEGKAKLVLRGTAEVIVPVNTPTLSRQELASLGALFKQVAKALSSKTGAALLKADLVEGLGPLLDASARAEGTQAPARDAMAEGTQKPELGAPFSTLLSAVDATRDPGTGLSFVPAIIEKLNSHLDAERAKAALLEAARSGLLELRPEGGIGRLSPEELLVCPSGPQGTRLSWARRPELGAR